MRNGKQLPPLADNYFGSQIDEVSSARDSVIENESQINSYNVHKIASKPEKQQLKPLGENKSNKSLNAPKPKAGAD